MSSPSGNEPKDSVPTNIKEEGLQLFFKRVADPVVDRLFPNISKENRRVVRYVIVVALVALIAAFGNWGVPYFAKVVKSAYREWTLPRAKGDRIAIVVADLSGDESDRLTNRVENALAAELSPQIEILRSGEPILTPSEGSYERRREFADVSGQRLLRRTHADVLIWGEAVEAHRYVDIHFLAANAVISTNRLFTYSLDETLRLPTTFGGDIDAIVSGMAIAIAAPANDKARYHADVLSVIQLRLANLIRVKPPHSAKSTFAQILRAYGLVSFTLGDQSGDQKAFLSAISAFQREIGLLDSKKEPREWGHAQAELGNALTTFGFREPGIVPLEGAVTAERRALEVFDQKRSPLEWATTLVGLADALRNLGERSKDVVALSESVAVLNRALGILTQRRAPLQWARAKNDLGDSLFRIAQRKNEDSRLLKQAIAAYRDALTIWTRERAPLYWARAQSNLGNALALLCDTQGSSHCLEAIVAYKQALKEYTSNKEPSDWAMTENNLGNTLLIFGERQKNPTTLRRAVAAFKRALQVRSRDRQPLVWADTEDTMGYTFEVLGVLARDRKTLLAALAAHQGALEVYDHAKAAYDRDAAASGVARTKELLAKMDHPKP